MDIRHYNRAAWDRQVQNQNRWTIPVSSEAIARARLGHWEIVLTPSRPVPRHWFPELAELEVLCLASGGGQQSPILAARGARVPVLDNSPQQLAQDRLVAERERLAIRTVEGDMANLEMFADEQFDLIVHPCSNCFVPDVRPVWREAFRVLRAGGVLLAGFSNPVRYLFEDERSANGSLNVRYTLPYSDLTSLSGPERQEVLDRGDPLEFGHSLDDQIGGQLAAGFVIDGFYEDSYPREFQDTISQFMPTFMATRAVRKRDATPDAL